jgi:protein O-mannosyl-transferase
MAGSGRPKAAILLVAALLAGQARSVLAQSDLEERLGKVDVLLQRGDLKSAEVQLRDLARLHPKSFVVRNNLGALYMQQQRYPEACREFMAAADLNPEIADVQRNLGACLFLTEAFESAIVPLRRAKALEPNDPRTRYQLGYALLMLNRPQEAQPELEYVSSKLPGEEQPLFALVKLYQAEGYQDKAAAAFAKLQSAHPDSPFVHILMGESIAEFQKAISLAPGMSRLHFDLGFLYWEVNRFAEAVIEFRKEIQTNPAFAPAYYYLGDIALAQDRPSEAAGFFREAVSRGPGCLGAYLGLGKAYIRTDKVSEAAAQFELANRLDGNQADVHYWLATTYRRLGDIGRSQAEMQLFQTLSEKAKATPGGQPVGYDRWANAACLSAGSSSSRRGPAPQP